MEFDFGRHLRPSLGGRQMVPANWVMWGGLMRVLCTEVWAQGGNERGEGNVVPQGPPGGRHGYQKPTQGESCVRRRCWEGNWPLIEGWSQPDAATAPHGVGAPG